MAIPIGPVFPGRGKAPLEPQAFYVQLPVGATPDLNKLFRGHYPTLPVHYYSYPRLPDYGFTTFTNPNLFPPPVPPDTTHILRPVWRSLPDQPPAPLIQQSVFQSWVALYGLQVLPVPLAKQATDLPQQPWRLEQTWTRSYTLSLIGQDTMLAGKQVWELAPSQRPPEQIQLHSWQWSYNLSLVGKDRLPTGEQVYDLTRGQVPPEQIQLHSWSWRQVDKIGQDTMVTGEQVSDLPPRDPREVRTWSYQYLLTLIGQDRFPTGLQAWERPTLPQVPASPSWAWQYNPNLIGQDFLPFRQRDWPLPIAPQQPAFSWVDTFKVLLTAPALNITIDQYWERPQLPVPPAQTWTWQYLLSLIGQDRMATGLQVYDLAPIYQPYINHLRTWSWQYNLNLIGKDRLPVGEVIWERPTLPIPPALTWLEGPQYELIAKPFLQSDWPNPTQPYRVEQTWAASYNLNLIGQDRLPVGEIVFDLPPRDFARLFQTWISSVNAALVVTPSVLDILKPQRDWPVPRGAEPDYRRSWEWQYNKNLIGQDQLPIRQSDWPNPQRVVERAQTWIDQTKILLAAVQNPFIQTDWPIPRAPAQAAQTWTNSYLLNLIGQDQLPFRQQDWPLTSAQGRSADLATWVDRVKFQFFKPFAQTDWPNPTPPARDPTLSTIAASYNRNLIGQDRLPFNQHDWPLPAPAPQPLLQVMVAGKPFFLVPPQPLPPGAQLYDRFIDPRLAAADIAWPAWRWPQITPPPVTTTVPLRTLMGTGL